MKKMKITKEIKLWRSIIIGTIIEIVICLAMTALFAALLTREIIQEKSIGYIAAFIQLLPVIVGGLFAGKRMGKKYVMTTMTVGCIYGCILSCINLLAFGGEFKAIGMGVAMILTGIILSLIMCTIGKSGRVTKKRKL